METIRRKLMPGVYLTYIQETKFKTNVVSAQLVTPLDERNASANALRVKRVKISALDLFPALLTIICCLRGKNF